MAPYTEHLILDRDRLPEDVSVGKEFDLLVRGRVRRVEADHLDVTGYSLEGDTEILEGETLVEFTVVRVNLQ